METTTFKIGSYKGLIASRYDNYKLRDFIGIIEKEIPDGEFFTVIKDDASALVGSLKGEAIGSESDFIVKCYKKAGLVKGLARLISGSKARSLFKINGELVAKGLHVAEPVCFVDTFGKAESYFISKTIGPVGGVENFAISYEELIKTDSDGVAKAIAKELARWHKGGVSHGDMKWSNIMFEEKDGAHVPYFIDIDQAEICNLIDHKKAMTDVTRFCRYAIELEMTSWAVDVFMPHYMEEAKIVVGNFFTLEDVVLRATAEHELKKSKSRA